MRFSFFVFRFRLVVAVMVLGFLGAVDSNAQEVLLYSNDFDGNVVLGPGIVTTISGGNGMSGDGETGGIVPSQSYDSHENFGGDFWRVAAADDVLEFEVANTPIGHWFADVEFSLAIIDSWDGASGPDQLEIEILDGSTQSVLWQESVSGGATPGSNVQSTLVLNQQLGFNASTGDTWWLDDGYRMSFENIPMSGGSLTFRIHATGVGYQGGMDESFAIDNLLITAIPEPSTLVFAGLGIIGVAGRRRRTV